MLNTGPPIQKTLAKPLRCREIKTKEKTNKNLEYVEDINALEIEGSLSIHKKRPVKKYTMKTQAL